jgi:hypothetical protein
LSTSGAKTPPPPPVKTNPDVRTEEERRDLKQNLVVTRQAPPTAPPAPSPRATATPRPSSRLNCRIAWDASPLRRTVPILTRYVFALGAMYTVPTQCHTNPAIDTSHPSQAVEERINVIKAVVKQLASRDWKNMLRKFTQRHLTGKP